jgi:DNA polymerase I-like protein with 3'-5' exonuclease and polymerase domains
MKLNYLGTKVNGIDTGDFEVFKSWVIQQKKLGLDLESNVTQSILDRFLVTVQLANKEETWSFQWSFLTSKQQQFILDRLNKSDILYIIHGSTFEYTLLLKYGVRLKNIWDTYRAEQVLNKGRGIEQSQFDLGSVIFKRFGITLNKELQTSFGDNVMTKEKVYYMNMDVAKSVELYEIQLGEMKSFDKAYPQKFHKGLVKTMWWDNEFALVAGDLEYQGVVLDTNKWMECYNKYYPKMLEAKAKLDAIVIEEFSDFAKGQGWLSDVDRFESIWGSTEKKREILKLVFPNIESVTKLGLKEYLRDNDPDFPNELKDKKIVVTKWNEDKTQTIEEIKYKSLLNTKQWDNHKYERDLNNSKYDLIKLLLITGKDEDYTPNLNQFFYKNFPEFMLEHEYVIPANTLSLNWASPSQVLDIFKQIKPTIEDTKALTVEDNLLTHKLFKAYEEFKEYITLVTKYGPEYLNHVQVDGRIRTVYNTVLATGRLSAKEPNMLGLPRNNDYRACFTAPEGFKIIDADWDSQELTIIASLSNEYIWLHHLELAHDLHSVNAEIVLEDEWKNNALDDCNYYKNFDKCKCPKHKEQRTFIKSIDFGLAYGLSAYGLAARQHKTEEEAKLVIDKFFSKFTKVKEFLDKCGKFAVTSSMINNSALGGIRFFDKWKTAKKQDYTGMWVYANPEEARGVMRAGMNYPIQSFGADLLKVAFVLLRRWIINNNLTKNIQIALPYHDQAILYADNEHTILAAEKLEYFMKLSGKLLLKNDLLRASASISDFWKKD